MTWVRSFIFRRDSVMKVIRPLTLCVVWLCSSSMQAQQASKSAMDATDKDAVARGEVWFYQRCSLCHMERIVKDETYMTLGPGLSGLLKNAPASKEAQVRETIKSGSLRMPGFKYGLN